MIAPAPQSQPDPYILPRDVTEQERLDEQHTHLTELLGGRLIVVDDVWLDPGSHVLDSGTGSGSWILALSKTVPETVELVGIDISSTMFPKEIPSNVKLCEMSSTNLPEEWENSFDLVHQRLLLSAFTVPLWRAALTELFRVLKPGGSIQLIELGRFASFQQSDSFLASRKLEEIATAVYKKREVLGIDCGPELPKLLEEAKFSDIRVEIVQVPIGGSWGDVGVKGMQGFETAFRVFGAALIAEGGLGVCESQAEVDETIELAKKEWEETPGVFANMYVVTAKKPS